jgi:hypothetical protein
MVHEPLKIKPICEAEKLTQEEIGTVLPVQGEIVKLLLAPHYDEWEKDNVD